MPRKSNNPKGRDKIPIDWSKIDNLLMIHCTGEEVAAFLDISYDTIERRCKEEKKSSFADYSKLKRFAGKPSLRRAQWIAATEDKNPTMLIWLGKNLLDQTDKTSLEIPDGVEFHFHLDKK